MENITGTSQFATYEAFLPEANNVHAQLEDRSSTAPLIKDLESVGLIALFKSLSSTYIFNLSYKK